MMDGGIGEAALTEALAGAGEAAIYGGLGEGAAGAGASAAGAAGYGAGAGAAAYGAGAASSPYLAGAAINGMAIPEGMAAYPELAAESGAALSSASGMTEAQAAEMAQYKSWTSKAFDAASKAGKFYNKLPGPVQSAVTMPLMQGLLGAPQQGQQTNIRPPSGGGAPAQNTAGLLGMQSLPQVQPFAAIGPGQGPDDAEMKRRLMMRGYYG